MTKINTTTPVRNVFPIMAGSSGSVVPLASSGPTGPSGPSTPLGPSGPSSPSTQGATVAAQITISAATIAAAFKSTIVALTGQWQTDYENFVNDVAPKIAQYAQVATDGDQVAAAVLPHLQAQVQATADVYGIVAATQGIQSFGALAVAIASTALNIATSAAIAAI